MKNFIVTSIMCLTALCPVSATQIMTLLNGDEIEVEIIRSGTSEISYRKASDPNGPIYTTARSNVSFILYEDGQKEIFTRTAKAETPSCRHELQTLQDSTVADSAVVKEKNHFPRISSLFTRTAKAETPSYKQEPQTQQGSTVGDAAVVKEKNYFPRISFYPRAAIGFHATPSGYKDSYDIDWGGLYWSLDLNVLVPSGNNTAGSVGIGLSKLCGDMKMLYKQGGKRHKDKMGSFDVMYLTFPIQFWYKYNDSFMFGCGLRPEILISQKMNGKKVKDAFDIFRSALTGDVIYSVGKFDIGAQFLLNFSRALEGKDLDWSPTLALSFTAGYRF